MTDTETKFDQMVAEARALQAEAQPLQEKLWRINAALKILQQEIQKRCTHKTFSRAQADRGDGILRLSCDTCPWHRLKGVKEEMKKAGFVEREDGKWVQQKGTLV